jgi:Flp pilus assembly pilin Flp
MRSHHPSQRQFGGALVEYALLVALIALTAINAVKSYGQAVDCQYRLASRQLRDGNFDIQAFPSLQYFCDNPSMNP